jgi:hypothetical protein
MAQFRLKDRGILKEIPDYRKHVYRFTDNGISYIKVQIFGEKYRLLFEKNIQAIEFCKEHRVKVPDILDSFSEEMIIYFQDVGENVMDLEDAELQCKYIRRGIQELSKLHNSKQIKKEYYQNSYIEKFQNLSSNDEKTKSIQSSIDSILSTSWQTIYGPGVTDPTPSNMCFDSQGIVSLIDFDNFTMEVSFFESLGFIVGDYFFKKGVQVSDIKDLFAIVSNWRLDEYIEFNKSSMLSNREFWLGFLSVYLTLYQDITLDIPKAKVRLSHFESNIQLGLQQLRKAFQL